VNSLESSVQRVIGLDAHPDTFTAAILRGPTPAAAITEKTFHRVPWNRLQSWLERHCGQADVFALEATRPLTKVEKANGKASAATDAKTCGLC